MDPPAFPDPPARGAAGVRCVTDLRPNDSLQDVIEPWRLGLPLLGSNAIILRVIYLSVVDAAC